MQEGNKFITYRTSVENPFSKYRSVKYRVAPSSGDKMGRTFTALNAAKQTSSTCKTSMRKPYSYSHKRQVNSSLTHSIMPEEEERELKLSYLSTWDKLLSSPDKSQALDQQESKVDILRVQLPSIINFGPSKFTALDPLFLPIQDIERGIEELKAALPVPKREMEQLHTDMANFQTRMMEDLESTERNGMRELKRLRNLLRTDSVEYQGDHLRLKRQCLSTQAEYAAYAQDFKHTKPRIDNLQDEIFSSRPFNLVHDAHFQQQFPQEYF